MPRNVVKRRPATARTPWNKGRHIRRSDQQHLYVPREDLQLFWAVTVYFAGPIYAAAIWFTIVTSRRISEALMLCWTHIHLAGGDMSDEPYVYFGQQASGVPLPGLGKLGAPEIAVTLSPAAVKNIEHMIATGIEWAMLDPLTQFQESHLDVFNKFAPLSKQPFKVRTNCEFLFPALKKSKRPCMSRQSVWNATGRAREVMFALTNRRRYNPNAHYNGAHVTVHGATRHTAAALMLWSPARDAPRPSDAVILEVQQRRDLRTFKEHYCHVHPQEVKDALVFAWVDPPFGPPSAALSDGNNPEASSSAASMCDKNEADTRDSLKEIAMRDNNEADTCDKKGTASQVKFCSRNACRKHKRKAGKQAWLHSSQESSAQ